MKKLYTLLIALIFIGGALGQGCLPDSITFVTQAEIDNFQTNHPNCTEIEGTVLILGNDITNLNGLNVLTSIGGDLYIGWFYSSGGNPSLTSLTGLDNVTAIGGALCISYNAALASLSGLENVTSIGGKLEIRGNNALIDLTGLDNLTSIIGYVEIHYNGFLTSLTGLDNVTYIGGSLIIGCNNTLMSLTGLDNVTTIEGRLIIGTWLPQGGWCGNASLTSLSALDNLTSIGDDLVILGNDALTSLTGLDNLTSIVGLSITRNHNLTSLSALNNVTFTGGGLEIRFNDTLSECEILSICNYLANPNGEVSIESNNIGCNSPEEVQDSCIANAVTVGEIDRYQNISIYPNPTHSSITIELPTQSFKNTFLTISNTNGQQLITQPIIEPQTEIDISYLPTGIYIVKVWNDKDVMVRKVIKQ